jgi:hypothetical protein
MIMHEQTVPLQGIYKQEHNSLKICVEREKRRRRRPPSLALNNVKLYKTFESCSKALSYTRPSSLVGQIHRRL